MHKARQNSYQLFFIRALNVKISQKTDSKDDEISVNPMIYMVFHMQHRNLNKVLKFKLHGTFYKSAFM